MTATTARFTVIARYARVYMVDTEPSGDPGMPCPGRRLVEMG